MPRTKKAIKGGAPIARIRENSRIMHTHESMVDFISARHPPNSFLDAFTLDRLMAGLNFIRTAEGNLEDHIIYSDYDDDDDDEDDDDDYFYPVSLAHRPLEPHPRIRQLTEEEADKHEKELLKEEERRKEKTERNKRKKLRKKERKRLEKESALKDILPDEVQGKSDPSENQGENSVFENNTETIESPESAKTQTAAGADKSRGNNKEGPVKMNKKEDEEQKVLDLDNSYVSTDKPVPDETCNRSPARERKPEKTELLEIQQPEEEKPKVVVKTEGQQKKEEKQEPNKENIKDEVAEEFRKRSKELAGIGNQLAASGQYEMAVQYFTEAIKHNPKEFKLFGNRSLCFERLQQYENAFRDADLALCMEPNWMKGLFRKGKALCGLKRYYEASLIYKKVLQLESSSAEAMQELKRAQTLHLMEMGFTWKQSSEALKTHSTLEEAVEALFGSDGNQASGDASACGEEAEQPQQPPVFEVDDDNDDDDDEGEWIVQQTSRPRVQQVRESEALSESRSASQSPTRHPRGAVKPELFSIWVGSLAPAVTYQTLHELFSRAGTVYSIKMLLEHQCAFVNYTRKEDCDRAIQCIDGMVVEGAPLSVRYPNRIHTGLGMSKSATTDPCSRPGPYKKECFFWRTTGCTRADCTYKHVPEHKNMDRDKFTSRLGNFHI